MKRNKLAFVFAAMLPLAQFAAAQDASVTDQQVAQPGSFDPATESARQQTAAAPSNASQVTVSQGVKTPGRAIVPSSSVPRAGDQGLRAHTNTLVFVPQSGQAAKASLATSDNLAPAASVTPFTDPGENPGSLGCVYHVGPTYSGCTRSGGYGRHPSGGAGAIAIVDAYHNPYAATDLANFSAQWSLPAANFTQIYCQPSGGTCYTTNTPPATDSGWGLEEALDIEWAHAMAPSAKIFLIEAASNSYADLTWAEAWAGYYVDINGGGEVSNSWGGGEFSTEANYDPFFNNYYGNYHPVVYFASGGDSGSISYPSASPYVVSAGGTTVNRDASGNYLSQTCWSGTGRGVSAYETIPAFQSSIGGLAGTKRSTTDLSFDSDPNTGVWVYDALNGGWFVVGGTSVASPALAGIVNNAKNRFSSTVNEENLLYSEYRGATTYHADFFDVAPTGYDTCTGIGTPLTLIGK